ncbi:C-C chemokine receptor type 9 [Pleurodeles waltl]|uniref:C-C chemokine receptor type 9 n=1 Tax=Pleurodeles waltl TaxID=8319 RepID=UPI0037094411
MNQQLENASDSGGLSLNICVTRSSASDSSSTMEDFLAFGDTGSYCEKSHVREFAKYFLPPIYWSVFLLGTTGNLLVIFIYMHYRRIKTMTDAYLLNLAIADLLFLATLPFWAISVSHQWIFRTAMCKAVNSIYTINVYSCMLFLACISVDRYMAIVQATRALKNKHKQLLCSKVVCISVWLLAMVLSLPELLYSEEVQGDEAKVCTMAYPSSFSRHIKIIVLSLKLTVGFCVPFLVMFFCYTLIVKTLLQARSFQKHKALKVIFTIITVFVVSQVPYNSILMMRTLEAASVTLRDCKTTVNLDIATQITQSLAFLHSSLNPLLYVFVGVQFRHDLFKILKKFGCMSRSQWARYVGSAWSSKRTSEILETKSSGTFTL